MTQKRLSTKPKIKGDLVIVQEDGSVVRPDGTVVTPPTDQREALAELTRLTEEYGGYDDERAAVARERMLSLREENIGDPIDIDHLAETGEVRTLPKKD